MAVEYRDHAVRPFRHLRSEILQNILTGQNGFATKLITHMVQHLTCNIIQTDHSHGSTPNM